MPILSSLDCDEINKLGNNVGIQLLKKQKTLIENNENRNQNLLNTSIDSLGLQQSNEIDIQPIDKKDIQ